MLLPIADTAEPAALLPLREPHNRLLAALPRAEAGVILPQLRQVALPARMVLFEPGQQLEYVYFPETAIISLVATVAETSIEVGTAGSEGMVGLSAFLDDPLLTVRGIVQVEGTAVRCNAATFANVVAQSPALQRIMRRYAQSFMIQSMHTSACNALHSVDQRCARWLLMTHDRVGSDTVLLTHDLIASMLSVRRAGVTVALRRLQDRRLVRCGRGSITVLDRRGLEGASCECYQIVAAAFRRLFPAYLPPEAVA